MSKRCLCAQDLFTIRTDVGCLFHRSRTDLTQKRLGKYFPNLKNLTSLQHQRFSRNTTSTPKAVKDLITVAGPIESFCIMSDANRVSQKAKDAGAKDAARVWRAWRTVHEMIRDRGYELADEEVNISLQDFTEKFSGEGGFIE